MKSLNETIREGETKKRQLEESLDALQEEVRRYLLYMNIEDTVKICMLNYLVLMSLSG
jgi:hypothetical protein